MMPMICTRSRSNRCNRIRALEDNDLLGFADIFVGQPGTSLVEIVLDEMANRKIGL